MALPGKLTVVNDAPTGSPRLETCGRGAETCARFFFYV